MLNNIINPQNGDRYALEGKVVTMDCERSVLECGVIYIHEGIIQAVQPEDAAPPQGFESAPVIHTGGTIYPGLIELHNHLSYNILPLWIVPQQFKRREQWRGHKEKQKLVTGPMRVLGRTPGYVEAIVRYVECKCLVSGVTTSQGLKLYGVGIDPYYKGIVRNVEAPLDPNLPSAFTRIADVEAKNLDSFFERLNATDCLLLHLCEGLDDKTRGHFQALQFPDGRWAISRRLAGIHCTALTPEQFQVLGDHRGNMVWSPFNNLLLYGDTAHIQAAKEAGVLMSIGSDWSPSGSKNLLCEIKVAHLVSEARGGVFSMEEIVAMATINAARILKWDHALGSIENNKLADLLVIDDRHGDPYQRLLHARETSVKLVIINGVPRYGQRRLMGRFDAGAETEPLTVGRSKRELNLHDPAGSPLVGGLKLGQAIDRLQEGLGILPELALALEAAHNPIGWLADMGATFETTDQAFAALAEFAMATGSDALVGINADEFAGPIAFLELDNEELEGETLRPHPMSGDGTGFPFPEAAAVPYSDVLRDVQIELDGLTVVDDKNFFSRLAQQINLPPHVKCELPGYYGREPVLPNSAEPFKNLDNAVKAQFATTMLLSDFTQTGGYLSKRERQRIVEQALVLMEQVYVHLPLKRAMYAVNPIQRLRLLQHHLEQQEASALTSEIEFHNEVTSIFTSVRDLHTNYLLPRPFRDMIAFLPFVIEEYYDENDEPRYIVSKVVGTPKDSTFRQGVEVLYWNGIPICKAVEQNAERQAGGNPAARHARGLDAMTIRPLVRLLPPIEEWVTLRYRDQQQQLHEIELKWRVFSPYQDPGAVDPDEGFAQTAAKGYDLQTDAIHQVKKIFFAATAIQAERDIAQGITEKAAPQPARDIPTSMPTVFRAREAVTSKGKFAYIRIFTFMVKDAGAFVNEFVRLVGELPQNGLIIDVRGNGGGLIYAAECLLQVLTPKQIEPQRAQFINSPLTLQICDLHDRSQVWDDFDLGPWVSSIRQSVETGATFSQAFPITPKAMIDAFSQVYYGPKVLITDALCYSATDMFAAGFQDHGIGEILGTSSNMGAGGANVWTHDLLSLMFSEPTPPYKPLPASPFKPLPRGAGMRVSVRRTLRSGELAGTPLEDLGVQPSRVHRMTLTDLLEGNSDLIEKAGRMLVEMPTYNLAARVMHYETYTLEVEITTLGIQWLELLLNNRLLKSLDVADGTASARLEIPPGWAVAGPAKLELRGYADGELVAMKRVQVEGE